jgi:uncharacterized protein with GYD domain
MPTYLVIGNFTDQGVRNVKDTLKRLETVRGVAKKLGITVKDAYWTLGQYDIALVAEAPDEAAMTAFGLSVGAQGNVRTQTMRAFTTDEMGKLLGRMV